MAAITAVCLFLLWVPTSTACLRDAEPCDGFGCPAWTGKDNPKKPERQKKTPKNKAEARNANPSNS